jgi:hypothetical protein
MIVFQSPLAGVAGPLPINQRAIAGIPSPGGPNERSECRFVCCSGVGQGEGELNHRGWQSALIFLLAFDSPLGPLMPSQTDPPAVAGSPTDSTACPKPSLQTLPATSRPENVRVSTTSCPSLETENLNLKAHVSANLCQPLPTCATPPGGYI